MYYYCKNCGAELGDRYPVCIICRKGKGYGNKYCAFCGHEHEEAGQAACTACGKKTGPEDPKKPVTPGDLRFSPIAAALITLIVPGFGAAFNGQMLKGIGIFIAYVLLNGFTAGPKWGLYVQGAYAAVMALDAFLCAKRLKDEECLSKFHFF